MRFLQPNSFPRLLVIAFAMVALPLILALINNAVSINQFASRSQLAVHQAVQSTQASRRLAELLGALERNARQMVILGDRSLLDAYESNREAFLKVAGEFAKLPFDAEQRLALDEIVSGEAAIYAVLRGPGGGAGLSRAAESFAQLDGLVRGIIERGDRLIDREIEAMREIAARAQMITLWQMLALVPVALLLAAGFTVLIARPIRQIDAAVRRMGAGDFTVPVGVSGPRDLQMVGRRIEWLRHRLSELEQQKNRFLRQVSHELKTPLTALREGSELLSEEALGKLTPEQQEVAGILRANSIELQRLIDQNLALRARALRVAPQIEDITLEADPEKLRIMLDNLLSNAVKFSPEGGVIEVDVRSDGAHALLEVSDSGPGIPPAERERVFDPFFRGRSVAGGPLRGSGIGLSVVRDYAQAHGGTVEVVDEPRQSGARLRLRLPLRQVVPA
jgi:two-component system, NtrC family, sensor histidine kinase GlrK